MNGNNPPAFDPQAQLLTHPQEIKFGRWLYKTVAGIETGTAEFYRTVERDAVRFYLSSPAGIIPIFLDYRQFVFYTRQFFGYKVEPITLEQLESQVHGGSRAPNVRRVGIPPAPAGAVCLRFRGMS